MKKIILLILIALGIFAIYNSQENNSIESFEDDIKEESQQEIKTKVQAPTQKKITKLEVVKKSVKKNTGKALILKEKYRPVIKKLKTCLIKDHCGMKRIGDDPFFDPSLTDGMKRLEETLGELLKEQKKSNEQIIETDSLLGLFELPSHKIHKLSLQILTQNKLEDAAIEKILKASNTLTGEAKADFYIMLQRNTSNPALNAKILETLNEDLKSADGFTIVTICENLHKLILTEKEWEEALSPLCKIKTSDESNWLQVRYHFNEYAKKKDFSSRADEYCE
jgi:hypothetical protein